MNYFIKRYKCNAGAHIYIFPVPQCNNTQVASFEANNALQVYTNPGCNLYFFLIFSNKSYRDMDKYIYLLEYEDKI
jgi:hypothetical protein